MKKTDWFTAGKFRLYFIFLGLLYIISRMYLLTSLPGGYNVDELGIACDSFSIAADHIDRYGYKMPFYLINYGGGMSISYTYMTALLISLFGYSKLILRLPAVIMRLFFSVFSSLSAYELFGSKKAALFTCFLSVIWPVFFMAERFALDSPLMLYFWSAALYFLIKGVKSSHAGWYAAAGVFLSAACYSYALGYVILPFFVILVFICLLISGTGSCVPDRKFIRHFILMGAVTVICVFPLILMLLINNGYLPEIRATYFSIPKLPVYRGSEISPAHIKDNLYLIKDLLTNDWLYYSAVPEFQTMYILSVILVPMGLVLSIAETVSSFRRHIFSYVPFILSAFISVSAVIFMLNEPTVSRSYSIYLSFLFFDTLSVRFIYRKLKKVSIGITAFYAVSAISFFIFYFSSYNAVYPDVLNFGQPGLGTAIQEFSSSLSSADTIYVDSSKAFSSEAEIMLYSGSHAYDWNRSEKRIGRYHYDVSAYSGPGAYIADNRNSPLIASLKKQDMEKADSCGQYSLYISRKP